MNGATSKRKGFPYSGLTFSEDGGTTWLDGRSYREIQFPKGREKQFIRVVIVVILLTFTGIPLLSYLGLRGSLFIFAALMIISFLLFNRKMHRCPQCNSTTRKISTVYMNSPVLFFCDRCHLFFEHGEIDGGSPFQPE